MGGAAAAPGSWLADLAWAGRLTGARVATALVLFPRPERPGDPAKK
jgi:hypothetical protein